MRISDWSSDVCSSDLEGGGERADLQLGVPKDIHDLTRRREGAKKTRPVFAVFAPVHEILLGAVHRMDLWAPRSCGAAHHSMSSSSAAGTPGPRPPDRKSTRLNSSH